MGLRLAADGLRELQPRKTCPLTLSESVRRRTRGAGPRQHATRDARHDTVAGPCSENWNRSGSSGLPLSD
eukprot:1103475-Prymnesium_polylepis.1